MDTDTEDQEKSEALESGRPRGHRYWMPIGILILMGVAVGWAQGRPDLDRNIKAWLSVAAGLLGMVLVLLWFVFLSRFRWSLRLSIAGLLVLVVFGGRQMVRVDGTTDGRGLPRLVWRWAESSTAALGAPTNAPTSASTEVASPARSMDVPQFLGPNRDGLITGVALGRDWTTTPPRELWRQAIGQGWSAFSVVGGRAYTQEQRGEDECVTCYELVTGRLLWTYANRERFSQWQAGDGPHATPTIDGGRVYAYGAKGHLVALDSTTGARAWSRSVLAENQLENLEWGTSASPLLADDLVVVTGGQSRGPTVFAYRRSDGELQWKSGTDRASYASPILVTLAGRRVILSFNAGSLAAYDPKSGKEVLNQKWGLDGPPKAAQPVVVGGDRVLVTAGYGMGCELFQASSEADGMLKLTSVWKNVRLKAQFNSVAVREGHFYGLDDGLLACVTVANGERKWKDGRYGSGQSLLIDDLAVIQSESGDVVLAEAKPYGFRELGRIAALSSKTWNFPTVAGRYLLARNDREAVCYELPMAEAASDRVRVPSSRP